jgi:radical SAM superfamily enzyme YgiQ (UPF0313 family)
MVLPALTEVKSPFFRPIKYSLFPPLGLATLAAYCRPDDEVRVVDEHVEPELSLARPVSPLPDLIVIECYITNAYRSYAIADYYRSLGTTVAIGGLHPTAMPDEAAEHADVLFLGPGEQTFPAFLVDWRAGRPASRYDSRHYPRTLVDVPPVRRDLIQRWRYLVPNSIVVSRGCPHHCDFCYKDAFYEGGRHFYNQSVDAALSEIERLPGRHLYFLDDHLLGHRRFAETLFEGMQGMGRVFQGAATVDSILRGDLIEHAAAAGLRSVFVGFETLNTDNLRRSNKSQNLNRSYEQAIRRLHDLGIAINGSFVFGLDEDDGDVFDRTVDWAVEQGLTTSTFHIATPYPGTPLYQRMEADGRILTRDWRRYDTRHAVFQPARLSAEQLEAGYWRAYREFYRVRRIIEAARRHDTASGTVRHLAYTLAWKRLEPIWHLLIKLRQLPVVRPMLEGLLDVGQATAAADRPRREQTPFTEPDPSNAPVAANQ